MPQASSRSKASPANASPKPSAPRATKTSFTPAPCKQALNTCCARPAPETPFSQSVPAASAGFSTSFGCGWERPRTFRAHIMRISDKPIAAKLKELGVELRPGVSLTEKTSLEIGGTTDQLLLHRYDAIPEVMRALAAEGIPHKFLGGGTNVLVDDGELPWVMLHLPSVHPGVRIEGGLAYVDASAGLGGTVTFCAKNDLGGMEGLIGVPGSIGGALRMNAGAYGTQIGTYVREVQVYRAGTARIEILKGAELNFEYRHTSFALDDIMLSVKLELPSKPYNEILQGIRICNEKRRASQPLNQKSAGCIFKNPPGGPAGRMIDELGLKGHSVGDARVSDRHANFFINAGHASAADMLALIADVRHRVRDRYGVELEEEVIVWKER